MSELSEFLLSCTLRVDSKSVPLVELRLPLSMQPLLQVHSAGSRPWMGTQLLRACSVLMLSAEKTQSLTQGPQGAPVLKVWSGLRGQGLTHGDQVSKGL